MFHLISADIEEQQTKCLDIIIPYVEFEHELFQTQTIQSLEQLGKAYRIWTWKENKELKLQRVYPKDLEVDPARDPLFLIFMAIKTNAPIMFGSDGAFGSFPYCVSMGINELLVTRDRVERSEHCSNIKNCFNTFIFFNLNKEQLNKQKETVNSELGPIVRMYVDPEKAKLRLVLGWVLNLFSPAKKIIKTEGQFRHELIEKLEHYINRISSYHGVYTHGFLFFKNSRATNRQVNHLLSEQLLNRLQKNEPIESVFKDIQAQRDAVLVRNMGLNKSDLAKYLNTGIHSTELSTIVKQADQYIKQTVDSQSPVFNQRP
ncbi:hypothetical protein TUM19329_09650 [Legionella antarctica]|uniref:Uncharacterized protein n=1 Tax=Legionella antarctica TaxID=2708020 RepID=A0A6F8T1P6_9GAMM|nr:hypothetical protein [Legionella antarctica]BCA94604.1 hypothetical protein TUM19329_09650 [Legionella antarctica]